MSELLVRPTNPLHRSLKASSVRAPHDRRSSEGATFPKDILDLLATYFENVKEVRNMKGKLPDASTVAEHNQYLQEVLACATNLRKASAAVFDSSELTLYQSHVALAVTSDVGRMVYETRLTISPAHLSQFLAYSATKPPPLALARKLKSVFEKMQRLKVSIEQTSEMAEDAERLRLAPVRCDTYYTSTDIGALLTDIDNQFVLVQRMIVYLKGEVARLESKDRSDSTEKASGENGEEDGDLQFALKGMKISAQSDNDAHLLDRYNEVPQCSTPIVTRSTTRLNATASSGANADTVPNKSSFSAASASQNTMRFVKPRRATTTVWDSLRAGVKQAKRPNYSFELFEQMTDACEEVSASATAPHASMSAHKRDLSFRQFSSMYRHLRGSHHTSDTHNELVQEAAAVAVAQYASPVKKTHASQLKTPQSEVRVQNVPFVTSPTWQLAANSPGDWRHIRAYAATSGAPAPPSVSTKAPADSAVGFGKDYNSPLVGLVDYISKYAERQPKLPPAPLNVPTTQPLTSHTLTALNTNTESLGMRRERGSNLTESPKSRSASKDFTKPTFAPSLGVFGSSPTGSSGSGGKDSTLNPHTSPSATKKVLKPSTVAPALLTPGATTTHSASPTAAGAIASPIVAVPLTVPEIGKQLHEIYAKYVPEKLSDVPKLLAKYAGREKELLEKAIKKYGPVAPLASPSRAAHKSSPGGPPGSPLGTRPRPSGSIVDSDDQPRSRSASVASAASAGAGGTLSGVPKSIFGGGGKPFSTGFGASTVGAATSAPPSGGLFGGNATAGAGSLFKPAGSAAGAEVAPSAPSATPGASIFGAAPAVGAGSLFAKPSTAAAAGTTDPKQQILQRVTEIYTQHNPSKLSEIPQLLEKYKDRELQLIANLEKKYNVPHVPLASSVPAAAPVSAAGTSVFGGGAAATGATSIFGKGAGAAQPSTGFGAGAAGTAGAAGGGGSLFGKPSASATPTPFGNNPTVGAGASAGLGGTASPFGNTGSAGIPAPFGNTASPFGNATAAIPNAAATSGTGSLFGKPGPTASTGFGASSASQGGNGTGGLFGGGSAGVGGTSSPFTGAQNTTTGNLGTTGGLFGSSAGVAGNASPFANKNPATGGLFATPAAASGSPFNSGFNTPLGKTATPGASIFHQQSQAQTGGLGMGGMSMGLGGSAGVGGTASPGLFNRPTTATPGNSLFGGNTSGGGGVTTGFGNAAGGGSLFGGGSAATSAPVNSLSNINQIQQRVQAIYSQHNPSKLSEIPQLMEKYRGRELQLIANLEKKYNIDSSNAGQGNNNMMGGAQASGGFGAFGGNNAAHSGTSTGFGQASQMGGTGGLFGAQGGMAMGNNNPSTGFGGMNMGQNNNNSNITTSPGGSSLFGRPAGTATGFGNTGMNASMNNNMNSGVTPTGFGAPTGAGSSVFGSTTRLGGNNPTTGFGNVGSMGGGGLFGGGGGGNNMWGNR
eukprot:gene11975-13889_t